MDILSSVSSLRLRRSPYGERGLKYTVILCGLFHVSRSPYGERGLKYGLFFGDYDKMQSLSLRRAWIEIPRRFWQQPAQRVALLTESVD